MRSPACVLVALVSLASSSAFAQTTWTGAASTDWCDAANWTAGVPTASASAQVTTAAPRYPRLTGAEACAPAAYALTVNSGGTGARIEVAGGTITIAQEFTARTSGANTGLVVSSGTVRARSFTFDAASGATSDGAFTGGALHAADAFIANVGASFVSTGTAVVFDRPTSSSAVIVRLNTAGVGDGRSSFRDVVVDLGAGTNSVDFGSTHAYVTGTLRVLRGRATGNVFVTTALPVLMTPADYTAQTYVAGAITVGAGQAFTFFRSLYVNHGLPSGATSPAPYVGGSLTVEAGGSLTVGVSDPMTGSGDLVSASAGAGSGLVVRGGSVYAFSARFERQADGQTTEGNFTGGEIRLMDDFAAGAGAAFVSTGTTVRFVGPSPNQSFHYGQYVTMETPGVGPDRSSLRDVTVENGATFCPGSNDQRAVVFGFNSPIYVTGRLTMVSGYAGGTVAVTSRMPFTNTNEATGESGYCAQTYVAGPVTIPSGEAITLANRAPLYINYGYTREGTSWAVRPYVGGSLTLDGGSLSMRDGANRSYDARITSYTEGAGSGLVVRSGTVRAGNLYLYRKEDGQGRGLASAATAGNFTGGTIRIFGSLSAEGAAFQSTGTRVVFDGDGTKGQGATVGHTRDPQYRILETSYFDDIEVANGFAVTSAYCSGYCVTFYGPGGISTPAVVRGRMTMPSGYAAGALSFERYLPDTRTNPATGVSGYYAVTYLAGAVVHESGDAVLPNNVTVYLNEGRSGGGQTPRGSRLEITGGTVTITGSFTSYTEGANTGLVMRGGELRFVGDSNIDFSTEPYNDPAVTSAGNLTGGTVRVRPTNFSAGNGSFASTGTAVVFERQDGNGQSIFLTPDRSYFHDVVIDRPIPTNGGTPGMVTFNHESFGTVRGDFRLNMGRVVVGGIEPRQILGRLIAPGAPNGSPGAALSHRSLSFDSNRTLTVGGVDVNGLLLSYVFLNITGEAANLEGPAQRLDWTTFRHGNSTGAGKTQLAFSARGGTYRFRNLDFARLIDTASRDNACQTNHDSGYYVEVFRHPNGYAPVNVIVSGANVNGGDLGWRGEQSNPRGGCTVSDLNPYYRGVSGAEVFWGGAPIDLSITGDRVETFTTADGRRVLTWTQTASGTVNVNVEPVNVPGTFAGGALVLIQDPIPSPLEVKPSFELDLSGGVLNAVGGAWNLAGQAVGGIVDLGKKVVVVVAEAASGAAAGAQAVMGSVATAVTSNGVTVQGGAAIANGAGELRVAPVVAVGGANVVAVGGGNVVAVGGANVVAVGGANVVAAGGANVVAVGGANLLGTAAGNVIPARGANVVAVGGANAPYRLPDEGDAGLAELSLSAKALVDPAPLLLRLGTIDVVKVDARMLLQGAYDPATNAMRTSLAATGVVPLGQPFGGAHFAATPLVHKFEGLRLRDGYFQSFPDIVDWVMVELRTAPAADSIVSKRFALLRKDGRVVDFDGASPVLFPWTPARPYHIAVRPRNALPVLSAEPVSFETGTGTADFTASAASAYGGRGLVALGNGRFGLVGGDHTLDGQVTARDFNAFLAARKAGVTGYEGTDFDADGQVTARDFDAFLAATTSGAVSSVPEIVAGTSALMDAPTAALRGGPGAQIRARVLRNDRTVGGRIEVVIEGKTTDLAPANTLGSATIDLAFDGTALTPLPGTGADSSSSRGVLTSGLGYGSRADFLQDANGRYVRLTVTSQGIGTDPSVNRPGYDLGTEYVPLYTYRFRIEQSVTTHFTFRGRSLSVGFYDSPQDTRETSVILEAATTVEGTGAVSLPAEPEAPVAMGEAMQLVRRGANPARDRATFALTARESQRVVVEAFDALGRRVAVLFDGPLGGGHEESLALDISSLASGAYVVVARGSNGRATAALSVVR